jgi:hypothetical protein
LGGGRVSAREKSEGEVYCENCGLQIFPEKQSCTRCGALPTQQFVQLSALAILLLTIIGNSVAGWMLLPKLAASHPRLFLFRAWLWSDQECAKYGWMPVAAALLVWEFFVWRKVRKRKAVPKLKGWFSRKVLTFVLAAGFAPILPWWLPVGQPSDKTLAALARYPGLPCAVSWTAILVVAVILCLKAETRDLLLGRGKVLTGVSLGMLTLFLVLTLLGWSWT